jgi:hypothetical protein
MKLFCADGVDEFFRHFELKLERWDFRSSNLSLFSDKPRSSSAATNISPLTPDEFSVSYPHPSIASCPCLVFVPSRSRFTPRFLQSFLVSLPLVSMRTISDLEGLPTSVDSQFTTRGAPRIPNGMAFAFENVEQLRRGDFAHEF